ncbi:MAG TPA: phosphatidate cytidylyltransferase [Terracidiphilus sp.]|jgi:phosphatidate cytidylyltransferase|nr:phosphatidate cytidylyltransferase [Terracidiphilus sp.]
MKRVLTALVLAPLVLALVFFGPKWLVALAVAVVALLAGWEFLGLAERCGAKPPRIAFLVALAALFDGHYQWPDQTAVLLGGLSLALFIYCTFAAPVERVLADATACVFGLIYVGLTLLAIPNLRAQPNGPTLVVFLLFVVWAGDIAALYIGRIFGRHKLAPSLSPNKTWEGAIGSVAGSLLVTGGLMGVAELMSQWNLVKLSFADEVWWGWLIIAVVVNVAAQVGDLAESALKRSAGVKDSGTLLPGHGGVLDRIDALLLAAPVLWYAQVIR